MGDIYFVLPSDYSVYRCFGGDYQEVRYFEGALQYYICRNVHVFNFSDKGTGRFKAADEAQVIWHVDVDYVYFTFEDAFAAVFRDVEDKVDEYHRDVVPFSDLLDKLVKYRDKNA